MANGECRVTRGLGGRKTVSNFYSDSLVKNSEAAPKNPDPSLTTPKIPATILV